MFANRRTLSGAKIHFPAGQIADIPARVWIIPRWQQGWLRKISNDGSTASPMRDSRQAAEAKSQLADYSLAGVFGARFFCGSTLIVASGRRRPPGLSGGSKSVFDR